MLRKFCSRFLIFSISSLGAACSTVVEPVILPDLQPDSKLQEQFEIKLNALTFQTAKALNEQKYQRLVSRPGNAFAADVVYESSIARSKFPPNSEKKPYKLGVGDVIAFIQHIEPSTSLAPVGGLIDLPGLLERPNLGPQVTAQQPNTINSTIVSTTGRITNDGSVLLIGVGRIEAAGREIHQLRDAVRSVLIRDGKSPNFQLEIKDFNSQKAFLTKDSFTDGGVSSGLIPITDQKITARAAIAAAGISFNENVLTMIKIQREGNTFEFSLSELFSEKAPEIYLQDKDHIFIKNFRYVPGKVFLVGGVQPIVLPIKPEERQTLAEILFTNNGPMAVPTAQRSGVYLLRGKDPIHAYHLDAQNPARILVADAVELRPDDIVFVAEQPINTFNRVLATIFPLRILARDYQNDNLP